MSTGSRGGLDGWIKTDHPALVVGNNEVGPPKKLWDLTEKESRYFPSGTVSLLEDGTLRSKEELEPYLREPASPGWKPVYGLLSRMFGS